MIEYFVVAFVLLFIFICIPLSNLLYFLADFFCAKSYRLWKENYRDFPRVKFSERIRNLLKWRFDK